MKIENTKGSTLSSAQLCRANGWKAGTQLFGDEGNGRDTIEITAVGEGRILAKVVRRGDEDLSVQFENPWSLRNRERNEV